MLHTQLNTNPSPALCDQRRSAVMLRIVLFLSLLIAPAVSMAITLNDFDVVALKWDSGESVYETGLGVTLEPAPVNEGGVNLMLIDDVIPLYLTEGLVGEATVAFGFVDHNVWTPVNGDGNDLVSDFSSSGDRVYAVVTGAGNITLYAAPNFGTSVVIDSGSITLDPNLPLRLVIEEEFDWVYVYFGNEIVLQGNPFFGPGTPSRANFGGDMVISANCLCDEFPSTATVTINDMARDPTLEVYEFPQVFGRFKPDTVDLRVLRPFPIALQGEEVELAITLTNIGLSTASNISMTVGLPSGTDMSFTDGDTRPYGDLESLASTVRRIPLNTGATEQGVYPLSLMISSSGGNQTLETWLPVWTDTLTIDDVDAGIGSVILDAPYGVHTTTVVAPEIFDGDTPLYFDIQHVTHHVVQAAPFLGVHWGDVEAIGPAGRAATSALIPPETGNITGKIIFVGPGGSLGGVQGCVVQLINLDSGAVVSQDVTTADGVYGLGPAEYGAYKLKVLFPASVFGEARVSESGPFELGVPALTMDDWEVIKPPTGSAPNPQATPANGQGQSGTATTPPPPPPARKPKPFNYGRAGSMIAGFGVSLIVWGVDTFASPETLGGSLASFLIGSGAGAGANLFIDPAGQDMFYYGQEQTPPQTPGELTISENVVVDVSISPPLSFDQASVISTNYTYTRTTDLSTYVYAGTEILNYDFYLPMTLGATQTAGPDCGQLTLTSTVTTAAGDPLSGPDVLVQVWIGDEAGTTALSETLLRDDGQDLDVAAGDGIYTGEVPLTCQPGNRLLLANASRNGLLPHNSPPSTGFLSLVVSGFTPVDDLPKIVNRLYNNTPNPFNPTTQIRYDLAKTDQVTLDIFDIAGRRVRTLVNGQQIAGQHVAEWNGRDDAGQKVSSGVYLYRLRAGTDEFTQKMLIAK